MKVLVVGKGGREHALCKALAESPSVTAVFAIPGSAGMQPQIQTCPGTDGFDDVYEAFKKNEIDYVVIGPETPLVDGLADKLREKNVPVFGPDQRGASLEGSKLYSKIFMEKYGIPTAKFVEVSSVSDTLDEASNFTSPYVLKADGLAAGKGVFICKTLSELEDAATDMFEKKILGEAGRTAILEQFQPGDELSFFILTNGSKYVSLPMAQDHKRLGDGDRGPNTGGMGTVAPMSVSVSDYGAIISKVVEPTVKGLSSEGFDYRGVVFIGIMMTDKGPQVLEYNVRFGDPEIQVLLPLLDGDWGEVFKTIADGNIPQLKWNKKFATCVVLAAQGYPEAPIKGVEITGEMSPSISKYFLHAGTEKENKTWLVNGGRVLNAIGLGDTLQNSIQEAYAMADQVMWPGKQQRQDIGKKALKIGSSAGSVGKNRLKLAPVLTEY